MTDVRGLDLIYAGTGDDQAHLGPGRDVVHMGRGDDTVFAASTMGQEDAIDCGPGNDTLNYDRHRDDADTVTGCERVFVMGRTARNPTKAH
ncbi:MAG: calcium-binding protein [Nocardioides sp.]|nr:calcium-binding protein [Nocardioides sp.]